LCTNSVECPIPRGHPLHNVDPCAFTNGDGPPASASASRNRAYGSSSFAAAPTGGARRPNIVNGVRQNGRPILPSRVRSPPLSYTRSENRAPPRNLDYDDDDAGQDLLNRITKRTYPNKDLPKDLPKKPKIAISFNKARGEEIDGRLDSLPPRPRRRSISPDYPPRQPNRAARRRTEMDDPAPRPLPRKREERMAVPSAPNWEKFKSTQSRTGEDRHFDRERRSYRRDRHR